MVHIDTISKLHNLAGVPAPKHPLLSIHRLENLSRLKVGFPTQLNYGFYSIALKKNLSGYLKYGRRNYDFQEGALGFTEPYQAIEFNSDIIDNATGWMLFFHKELLTGTPLNNNIDSFGFFKYETNEGLHLSASEEKTFETVFENIESEYNLAIDKHSKPVVISNLELLLTYSNRYYERQFIIRNEVDSSIFEKFKKELKLYFEQDEIIDTPSVEYFASKLNISSNYLSDLLKANTGKSTIEHIHHYIIDLAKQELLTTKKSISEIAFELGFEYPNYFSKLFKKKTGVTPTEFRIPT